MSTSTNPAANSWTLYPNGLTTARPTTVAILLLDGKVLVTGGVAGGAASADLFDPQSNSSTAIVGGTAGMTGVRLTDGRALLSAGVSLFLLQTPPSTKSFPPAR